jgi:hypothetical protein
MAGTITWKTKGKAKERSKDVLLARTNEGKELIFFMVGSYFTHIPSNVAYMQIVKSNSDRRFITNILCQRNLLLYNNG